jgi:hypothetical protein
VRILSDGDGGDVTQSNSNRSGDAFAGNWNGTQQSNAQSQAGTGGNAASGDATGGDGGSKGPSWHGKNGCGCQGDGRDGGDAGSGDAYGGDVDQTQNASNSNGTSQDADASSEAWQLFPRNEVRGNHDKEVMAR